MVNCWKEKFEMHPTGWAGVSSFASLHSTVCESFWQPEMWGRYKSNLLCGGHSRGKEAWGFETLRAGFFCSSRCSKNCCGGKNEELLCSVHCFDPNCNDLFSINQCKVSSMSHICNMLRNCKVLALVNEFSAKMSPLTLNLEIIQNLFCLRTCGWVYDDW